MSAATATIDAPRAIQIQDLVRSDPQWFLVNVLGWQPTPAARRHGYTSPLTPDQQRVVTSVRDNRRTAAPSGHAVGKTKVAAGLALWQLFAWPGTKIVTTAPGWFQVENLLWREIQSAYKGALVPLGGKLNQTELDLGSDWFAVGLSTDEPTRFQGVHAPRVMVIFDEATGVALSIWDAAEGIATGDDDTFLAIGNPTDPTSRFKAACDSGRWEVVRLSCLDHPNVVHDDAAIVPGCVTKRWVEEHIEDYGGEDSPMARAKILGLWPEQGEDMLIALKWVEDAQRDWTPPQGQPEAVGCDVARFGNDETVVQELYPNGVLAAPRAYRGQDTMQTAGMLKALACPKTAVDDAGVGGGVTDRLSEQKFTVTAVNNSEAAYDAERFMNRRAECYWLVREMLRKGELKLPPDVKLAADLTTVRYSYDSKGRIKLEEKNEIKKRLGRSPDRGDATVLAVWARYGTQPDRRVYSFSR